MAIELKDIPEPIGKWLIDNAKKSFPTESGTYYHYVEVCRLLQLMKDECESKPVDLKDGDCNLADVTNCKPPLWLDANNANIIGRIWNNKNRDGDERRLIAVETLQRIAKEFGYDINVNNAVILIKAYCL